MEEDDDDDYEPDYYSAEDTEQILNKLDEAPEEEQTPPEEPAVDATLAALGSFKLPPAPVVNPETALKLSQAVATRVFEPMSTLGEPALRKPKAGINRLAASSYDRDSWLTVVVRLAARSSMGLEDPSSSPVKDEDDQDDSKTALDRAGRVPLSQAIRELLYAYVMEDFRRRIDVAVAWLCEEWYTDQLARRTLGPDVPRHYDTWALRLVDGFLPYLTPQDKVLTRFLAEIPELDAALLGRIKSLCRDPSTVPLALTSLLYLVMMRPPARETALDVVQTIWTECKLFSRGPSIP